MEGKYEILVVMSLTFRRYGVGFSILNRMFLMFSLWTIYK